MNPASTCGNLRHLKLNVQDHAKSKLSDEDKMEDLLEAGSHGGIHWIHRSDFVLGQAEEKKKKDMQVHSSRSGIGCYICYIDLAVPLEEPEKIGGLNPVRPPYKNIEVNEPDVFYSLRSKQNSTTCPVRYEIWVGPEIWDSPVILVDHSPHLI